MLTLQLVTNKAEMEGVLALQQANLRKNISEAEAEAQGFLMADLVQNIERCFYNGTPIENYVIVAQLCVSKDYRGLDLVQQLYGAFRDQYASSYTYCVTDVAQANARSLRAHQKRGFQVIDTLDYGGIGWDIVLWDWHKKAAQES
jgi:hypothetical protein